MFWALLLVVRLSFEAILNFFEDRLDGLPVFVVEERPASSLGGCVDRPGSFGQFQGIEFSLRRIRPISIERGGTWPIDAAAKAVSSNSAKTSAGSPSSLSNCSRMSAKCIGGA